MQTNLPLGWFLLGFSSVVVRHWASHSDGRDIIWGATDLVIISSGERRVVPGTSFNHPNTAVEFILTFVLVMSGLNATQVFLRFQLHEIIQCVLRTTGMYQ